jgi:hypothetical protein
MNLNVPFQKKQTTRTPPIKNLKLLRQVLPGLACLLGQQIFKKKKKKKSVSGVSVIVERGNILWWMLGRTPPWAMVT